MLAAVDHATSREEAARTFSVSVPTLKCWLKRRRETGGVGAMPIPGVTVDWNNLFDRSNGRVAPKKISAASMLG